jgi:hypothetical protein
MDPGGCGSAGAEERKDSLLDKIARRIRQDARMEPLFTLRWRLT